MGLFRYCIIRYRGEQVLRLQIFKLLLNWHSFQNVLNSQYWQPWVQSKIKIDTDTLTTHSHKQTQQIYHHSPSSRNLAKKRSNRAGKHDIAANITYCNLIVYANLTKRRKTVISTSVSHHCHHHHHRHNHLISMISILLTTITIIIITW